ARPKIVGCRQIHRRIERANDKAGPEEAKLAAGSVAYRPVIVARSQQELIGQAEQLFPIHSLERAAEAVGVLAGAVERTEGAQRMSGNQPAGAQHAERIAVLMSTTSSAVLPSKQSARFGLLNPATPLAHLP